MGAGGEELRVPGRGRQGDLVASVRGPQPVPRLSLRSEPGCGLQEPLVLGRQLQRRRRPSEASRGAMVGALVGNRFQPRFITSSLRLRRSPGRRLLQLYPAETGWWAESAGDRRVLQASNRRRVPHVFDLRARARHDPAAISCSIVPAGARQVWRRASPGAAARRVSRLRERYERGSAQKLRQYPEIVKLPPRCGTRQRSNPSNKDTFFVVRNMEMSGPYRTLEGGPHPALVRLRGRYADSPERNSQPAEGWPIQSAGASRLFAPGDDFCRVWHSGSHAGARGRMAAQIQIRRIIFAKRAHRSWNLHRIRAFMAQRQGWRPSRGRPRSVAGDAGCTRASSAWSLCFGAGRLGVLGACVIRKRQVPAASPALCTIWPSTRGHQDDGPRLGRKKKARDCPGPLTSPSLLDRFPRFLRSP